MYLSLEEIIAVSKEREVELRRVADSEWGVLCDAVRGFVHISRDWYEAVSTPFNIDPREMATRASAARVTSLRALTGRTIEVADEIVRVVQAGSAKSALALWRTLAEAKNNALLIDLDVSGEAGFLWLHLGVIEGTKSDPTNKELAQSAEQSKEFLADAGFEYNSRKRDPWAIGIDRKIYANALSRSEYIARHRKLPPEIPRERYAMLAAEEQAMIRKSNAVAHPTLFRGTVDAPLPVIMLAAIIDPMAVMLAYKVAASDFLGWPRFPTVGEQFTIYPPENPEAGILSAAVKAMHFHCLGICREFFLSEEIKE